MVTSQEIKVITSEINACLIKYGLCTDEIFEYGDIIVPNDSDCIAEASTIDGQKLATLILDKYFPLNPVSHYHHFTDITGFEGIISNTKLRLASVSKRFEESEFLPFYEAHSMHGYELRTQNGIPLGEDLCKNAFYISFTGDNLSKEEEMQMWGYFSKGGGVRLIFELCHSKGLDLRKMYYPSDDIDVDIKELTDLLSIASKRNRHLVIPGISRIGFFYLPCKYHTEKEYRLLIMRNSAQYLNLPFRTHHSGYEYTEIPINDTNFPICLKLKKVVINMSTDKDKVETILKSNSDFKDVKIEIQ